jgi:hypothetical protein
VLYRWRWALFLSLAALLCGQTSTFAEATLAMSLPGTRSPSLVQLATKKSVIDKSCIMMCDQWGEHGCLKWVMRCKGDPGYPKGLSIAQ